MKSISLIRSFGKQLVDVPQDSLDQFTSGRGIIQRNVSGDGV
jgi:hypothetical protein